jgi:hypothetical protein
METSSHYESLHADSCGLQQLRPETVREPGVRGTFAVGCRDQET